MHANHHVLKVHLTGTENFRAFQYTLSTQEDISQLDFSMVTLITHFPFSKFTCNEGKSLFFEFSLTVKA